MLRDPKEHHASDPCRLRFFGDEGNLINGELGVTGHRLNRVPDPLALNHEDGKHELGGMKPGLGDNPAQGPFELTHIGSNPLGDEERHFLR